MYVGGCSPLSSIPLSTIAPPVGSFHSLLDGEVGIDHPLSALPW